MQAIKTRFLPPTNYRPSRIVAECARGKKTFSCSAFSHNDEQHTAAAIALLDSFAQIDAKEYKVDAKEVHWMNNSDIHSGQLADGSYVHVLARRA